MGSLLTYRLNGRAGCRSEFGGSVRGALVTRKEEATCDCPPIQAKIKAKIE
jgi:hypothetical protein